jgi:hypothetical protein
VGLAIFISFRLVVTVGVAGLIAVASSTLAFMFVPEEYRNALIFFVAAAAAAGQLAIALYTARLLQLTINTKYKDEKYILANAAAKFGEKWIDTSMYHVRKVCREVIESRAKPQEITDAIKADKDKEINVINILNFLEVLSMSVNQGLCDHDIAKCLFWGIVTHIWHATEPWIKSERIRLGRVQAWAELEALYLRWK